MNKQYTDSQSRAINWGSGPVIILAGPGSGKTAVLTERIRRILKESENDTFRILALTFTNKAAQEMSERILTDMDGLHHRLYVGTFHSFCSEVLRNHGTYIGVKSNFDIYNSDDDLNEVLNDICLDYMELDPSFPGEKIKLLSMVKYFERKLCFTKEDVEDNMPHTQYKAAYKWIYAEYLDRMLKNSILDFDMLIMLTYKLFVSKPAIARIYARTYKYINVDEFQDTNYGQYMVLTNMCSAANNNNIFIVADDDQVIYGWNGADHRRISEFKEEYKADLIQLNQNFRCPEDVIAAANNLIAYNSGRESTKKPLEAMKVNSDSYPHIYCNEYDNEKDEARGITEIIKGIKCKTPRETICVLARTNRLLELVFEEAKGMGIECEKSKRKSDFEIPYVLWIFLALKLANHRTDKRILKEIVGVLSGGLGLNIDEDEIILESDLIDGDLLKALCTKCDGLFNDRIFEKSFLLNLVEGKSFIKFIDDAFKWSETQIEKIEEKANREQVRENYNIEKNVWLNFQKHLGYNYNLDEMLLSTYIQEFSMVSKEEEPREDAVQFLTIHASKGKEFDHVILMGMANDELPSFQSLKKGEGSNEMEEERRNCFVAITRTKKILYLTYAKQYFGWKKDKSIFLAEGKFLQ